MKISLSLSLAGLGFPIIFPASDWDNCPLELLFSAARCLRYQGTHVVVAVWRNLGVNVYKIIFQIPFNFSGVDGCFTYLFMFLTCLKIQKSQFCVNKQCLNSHGLSFNHSVHWANFLKIIRLSLKINFYITRHLLHKNTCLLNRLKQDFFMKKYIYIFLKTFVLTKYIFPWIYFPAATTFIDTRLQYMFEKCYPSSNKKNQSQFMNT